jgi:competence protein ComEA
MALVLRSQAVDQWIPDEGSRRLEVVRGQDSSGMGPVNLLSPPDFQSPPVRDLNEVSRRELLAISGIGPSMADAILGYREEHGPFASIDELERVPGIGPKRRELFSRHLKVKESAEPKPGQGVAAPLVSKQASEGSRTPSPDPSKSEAETLNLNEANRSQLIEIPGIGEAFADRILDQRKELGKFRSWADVDEVSGVGPKRLENLKRHATID